MMVMMRMMAMAVVMVMLLMVVTTHDEDTRGRVCDGAHGDYVSDNSDDDDDLLVTRMTRVFVLLAVRLQPATSMTPVDHATLHANIKNRNLIWKPTGAHPQKTLNPKPHR